MIRGHSQRLHPVDQDPAYRPARPSYALQPASTVEATGLIWRNALAISPGFSVLLDVRRPSDGPSVDLAGWGLCGVPSAWWSPTARQLGGSPRWNRHVRCPALPPGWRVVALGEGEGTPHPVHLTFAGGGYSLLAIPEVCLPDEGMALEIDKIFWETVQG